MLTRNLLPLLCCLALNAAVTWASVDESNMCIIRHMLMSYTGDDSVTYAGMAELFDSITVKYHRDAPSHMAESQKMRVSTVKAALRVGECG